MPIIFRQELQDETEIGLWKITEETDELLETTSLSEQEQLYLAKKSGALRKNQFLAARLLLAELTNKRYPVHYHGCGRPYIPSVRNDISVSHSGSYVGVAVSVNRRVGIDVEIIPRRSLQHAREYFLNEKELIYFRNNDSLDTLHICWSAKEALFKYAASPSLIIRDHIILEPFQSAQKGSLQGTIHTENLVETLQLQYWVEPEYVLLVTGK